MAVTPNGQTSVGGTKGTGQSSGGITANDGSGAFSGRNSKSTQ